MALGTAPLAVLREECLPQSSNKLTFDTRPSSSRYQKTHSNMPVGLETRCQEILVQVVTISQAICISALEHTNEQNFNISDRLRCQLETIRTSANTILGAFTRASLTDYTIDD